MDGDSGKPAARGLAAFASRDFRRYQMARMAVILGAEAQTVAVAWQVYSITHRALDLGYTGLALFVPGLFFLLPAGHVARQRLGAIRKPDPIEQLSGASLRVGARETMHPAKGPGDVLFGGKMSEQVEALKDHAHADSRPLVGDGAWGERPVLYVEPDVSTRHSDAAAVPGFEMVDAPQKGALA